MTSSMSFQFGASSSSFISSKWIYDVFLSFRGKDVRHNFISHLNLALRQRGISTYMDGIDLDRGEKISSELSKAIERSKISIIVFSKKYAESRWCLAELLKILQCRKKKKQVVLPIFYKVKPSDVREQKGSFGKAFTKLVEEIEDDIEPALLNSWKKALKEVAKLSGLEYSIGHDEAEFIQKIIQWVNSKIANDRTALDDAKHPVGIESRALEVYQLLNIENNDIVRVVGIFGMGGIGKTTISEYIYNQICSQFEGSCFMSGIKDFSKRGGGLIDLQNKLLYEILGRKLDITDVDVGANVLRHRLCSKKILLILDDVDELVQLQKLAGHRDWFGSGSRIIITTRDKRLLTEFGVDLEYEPKILDKKEALKLFSLHAFEKDEPPEDYVKLSKEFTEYAQGLPLALKVLGSHLHGRPILAWQSALGWYQNAPDRNIHDILQISYKDLDDNEKAMFLDIAFFFKGEYLDEVMEIFESCSFFPTHGIQRLTDKCLITINYKYIWMHDLLQDMGREIVRRESPKDPCRRSRLCFCKDVRAVFEEDTGGKRIEGILLDLPEGEEDEILLHPEAFRRMKNLRIFINRNACFSRAPNYLPDNLRVLEWFKHPLPDNFAAKNLIRFRMHGSIIKEIGDGFNPKKLTTIAFKHCSYLTEIPDLSSTSNLKELTVNYCHGLVKVHDSVGSLKNLSNLSFEGCSKLRILPRHLKLRSLHMLDLGNCSSLLYLPEIECSMDCLKELDLCRSGIEELPLSIGNLVGLQYLDLSKTQIVSLPTSIKELVTLAKLSLWDCEKLEEILELPPNIREVDVEGCQSLERFLEVSKILEFNGSHIGSLRRIELSSCNKMHVNIWDEKAQNPLLWKGLYDYDATLFPRNPIPDWFSYVHEFLKDNEMVTGLDDDVRPNKKEEWVIDMQGPHYLEEISGIVLYVVLFFKHNLSRESGIGDAKITSRSSNHVCYIQEGVQLVNVDSYKKENSTGYAVWVGYSNLQSFDLKVLDNLRVQFYLRHQHRYSGMVPFYTTCRAKVVYKNARRANKKRKRDGSRRCLKNY